MDGWVIIRTADSEPDAHLIAGFLRSAGIETVIDSRIFTQEPVGFGLLGGARIMVQEEQAEQARKILEQLDEGELAQGASDEAEISRTGNPPEGEDPASE